MTAPERTELAPRALSFRMAVRFNRIMLAHLVPSLLAILTFGCGGAHAPPPEELSAPVVTVVATAAAAPVASSAVPAPVVASVPHPPPGYVEMLVAGVVDTPGGQAVVLNDPERSVILPVFIGGTEALSIQLRYEHRRFDRPLTHDLLDAVLARLGGELASVRIDELRNDTFVGSLVIRRQGETMTIDARPSDAIALAMGAHVPIYVAEQVLQQAGVKRPPGSITPPEPAAEPAPI
jgi:bifunctional DNase/RNase